jgi:DNA-binding transcriptional MerR regulator
VPKNADELTIDELARTVGMTVRNVRSYAARGLLAPPRLIGRTGYYGPAHVEQLSLARDLVEQGLTLAAVQRVMERGRGSTASLALNMLRTVREPWGEAEQEPVSEAEFAARFGAPVPTEIVDQLVQRGLLERVAPGQVRVLQPDLLEAGQQAIAQGLPPEAVLAIGPAVAEHAGAVAKVFVDLVASTVWHDFVARGMPEAEWEEQRERVAALIPIAGQVLLASFRAAMRQEIDRLIPDVLEVTSAI